MHPSKMHPRSLPKLVAIGERRNRHIDRPVKNHLRSTLSGTADRYCIHIIAHIASVNLQPTSLTHEDPKIFEFSIRGNNSFPTQNSHPFPTEADCKKQGEDAATTKPDILPWLCVPRNSKHNHWQSAVLVKSSHHLWLDFGSTGIE